MTNFPDTGLGNRLEFIDGFVTEALASPPPDTALLHLLDAAAAGYGDLTDPLARARRRAALFRAETIAQDGCPKEAAACGHVARILARLDCDSRRAVATCAHEDAAEVVRLLEGGRDAARRIGETVQGVIRHDLDVDANALLGGLRLPVLRAVLRDLERFAADSQTEPFHRFRAYMILFGVFHRDPPEEGGTVYVKTRARPDRRAAARFRSAAFAAYATGIEEKLYAALRQEGLPFASGLSDYALRIPAELAGSSVTARAGLRIELDSCVGNDHVLVSQDIGAQILHVTIHLRDAESGAYEPPIRVRVSRIEEPVLRLSSVDKGVPPTDIAHFRDLFDLAAEGDNRWIRLSKAAVIATGIVPPRFRSLRNVRLADVMTRLGGGLEIRTEVRGVPVGSGTGTSSALAAAVVGALVKMTGQTATLDPQLTDRERLLIVARVLLVEQLIGALGGWQDPCVVFPGIKLLETRPGDFLPSWRPVSVSDATREDLTRWLRLTDGAYRQPSEAAAWQFTGLWVLRLRDVYEARMRTRRLIREQIKHLERGEVGAMGANETEDWINRRFISPKASNPYVERVIALMHGALGEGNVGFDACGARGGAGGCWWVDPQRTPPEDFARAFLDASRTAMSEHRRRIRFEGEPRIYDYRIADRGMELDIQPFPA